MTGLDTVCLVDMETEVSERKKVKVLKFRSKGDGKGDGNGLPVVLASDWLRREGVKGESRRIVGRQV